MGLLESVNGTLPPAAVQYRNALAFAIAEIAAQYNTSISTHMFETSSLLDSIDFLTNMTISSAWPGPIVGLLSAATSDCTSGSQATISAFGIPTVAFTTCFPHFAPTLFGAGFSEYAQAMATVSLLMHYGWASVITVTAIQSASTALEFTRAADLVMVEGIYSFDISSTVVFDADFLTNEGTELHTQLGAFRNTSSGPYIFVLFAPGAAVATVLAVAQEEGVFGSENHFWVVRDSENNIILPPTFNKLICTNKVDVTHA